MSSISTEVHTRIGADAVGQALDALIAQIVGQHSADNPPHIVGIARGGIPLAERIANELSKIWGIPLNCGQIDISFHRDDITSNPIPKTVDDTELPYDVEDTNIILVDDVLFTGRTVRAALNELFDLGRPQKVELAILFDRGGRCLPIQPDYAGFRKTIPAEDQVVVKLTPQPSDADEILIVKHA